MEHPSPRGGALSEDRGRRDKDGQPLCERRELPSQDRKHPCASPRPLSLRLRLPDEPRQLPSLHGEHPYVFAGMPDAWVGAPSQFTTDAPRTSTAPVRTRRGAFEERGAPVPAPRATLRAREGAMLTPRDAPPIRWDAPPIPEDALRVRRASARRLGDALPGADRAAAEPRACRPILRASRRPRSRPVGTPRGASRAQSGAVRVRPDFRRDRLAPNIEPREVRPTRTTIA